MRRVINLLSISLALLVMMAVSWENGDSYCVIFPQNGRDIFGVAQRNIIIFGDNEVSLIPQVNFEGNARDFGILVPVPALPELSTVGANIFTEASFMTQPIIRDNIQGCGCDEDNSVVGPTLLQASREGDMIDQSGGGVTVVHEQLVGMFQAVILQATSAQDLTAWLDENGYNFNPDDADIFATYIAESWFFVAMKLDTAQLPPFVPEWWSATTSPARLKFAWNGSTLMYPLKISSISTDERAEILVYTVGPDPMRFEGASVEYANAVDDIEADAMAENYPTLSGFIRPGDFVTKLRRSFTKAEMQQDVAIAASSDRREFREVRYRQQSGFSFAGIALLALAIYLNRRRK